MGYIDIYIVERKDGTRVEMKDSEVDEELR